MDPTDIEVALAKLGSTGREIAETLANKGIVGITLSPGRCPLARYLKDQFPGTQVSVAGTIRVGRADVYATREQVQFMNAFDRGRYPALEDPTAPNEYSQTITVPVTEV